MASPKVKLTGAAPEALNAANLQEELKVDFVAWMHSCSLADARARLARAGGDVVKIFGEMPVIQRALSRVRERARPPIIEELLRNSLSLYQLDAAELRALWKKHKASERARVHTKQLTHDHTTERRNLVLRFYSRAKSIAHLHRTVKAEMKRNYGPDFRVDASTISRDVKKLRESGLLK